MRLSPRPLNRGDFPRHKTRLLHDGRLFELRLKAVERIARIRVIVVVAILADTGIVPAQTTETGRLYRAVQVTG